MRSAFSKLPGWVLVAIAAWSLVAAALTVYRMPSIETLDLPDTDDAQRLVQVRDWLGGQAWGDVDQHRMNPPSGAEMHWSRLVDLPIAAIIVVAEPIVGRGPAERIAATTPPLLALLLSMLAAGLGAGRLGGRTAAMLAPVFMAVATPVLPMFAPLRIDHHGWQIALMLTATVILLDRGLRFASGVGAGIAVVAALMIGLEMLPHLAVASAVLVAGWCLRPDLGRMLSGYGVGLGFGMVAAYPAFVPAARWTITACDAMSPVYLAALLPAGIVAAVLPHVAALHSPARRITAAGLLFGAIAAAVAAIYPQCAGGPLAGLDPAFLPILANINEARPLLVVLRSEPNMAVFFGVYPLVGAACVAFMLVKSEREASFRWAVILAVLLTAISLTFLQIRAANAANVLAVVVGAAFAARLLPAARAIPRTLPRMAATAAVLVLTTSAFPTFMTFGVAAASGNASSEAEPKIKSPRCNAAATLAPIARLPVGTIMNDVDMGPALLLHTPHVVVAGPYHRRPGMILDSMRVWRAGEAEAKAIMARYGATYLLGCVGANDLKAAKLKAPAGFWAGLENGSVPAWLERVPLPPDSPLRIYRVRR